METYEERALRRIPLALRGAAQQLITESHSWPRSGELHTGRKVQCPHCGRSGYPGGGWVTTHVEHTTARCGATVTRIGRRGHEGRCGACQEMGQPT